MLKKLKSLFIVEEQNESAAKKSGAQSPANKATSGAAPNPASTAKTPSNKNLSIDDINYDPSQKPNAKFVNILLGAVDKSNQKGFDYLEYKQALQSLKDVDMDESTRYQSAFAMAKTMGTSVQKLINSAEFYIQVLQKENSKFSQAHTAQRQKLISNKKTEIDSIKKGITDKTKQIESLKTQIKKDEDRLAKLNAGVDTAGQKIEKTGQAFKHAYDTVVNQIVADAENIQKYLKQ